MSTHARIHVHATDAESARYLCSNTCGRRVGHNGRVLDVRPTAWALWICAECCTALAASLTAPPGAEA